jgi:hypothetical protein
MAAPVFLQKSDFVGEIEIDFGNYDEFNNFAYAIERKYAFELFGPELGRSILSNVNVLGAVIQGSDDYWTDTRDNDPRYRSRNLHGFHAMVKQFFYFEFITRVQDKRTLSGDPQEAYVRSIQGERHIKNNHLVMIYNKGVQFWNEIIDYIEFQEYSGVTEYYDRFPYPDKKETINTFGII